MGGEDVKENGSGGRFKYDIFNIVAFVNATMYPQHNNFKKGYSKEINETGYANKKHTPLVL
jgi:hypothetical protein